MSPCKDSHQTDCENGAATEHEALWLLVGPGSQCLEEMEAPVLHSGAGTIVLVIFSDFQIYSQKLNFISQYQYRLGVNFVFLISFSGTFIMN